MPGKKQQGKGKVRGAAAGVGGAAKRRSRSGQSYQLRKKGDLPDVGAGRSPLPGGGKKKIRRGGAAAPRSKSDKS